MPLQTGKWNLNSGGTLSTLEITKVDASGVVSGNIQDEITVAGFWDELTQRLTITGSIGTNASVALVGFLVPGQTRMPGITGESVATLAGYSTTFPAAKRSGWYAQIGTT